MKKRDLTQAQFDYACQREGYVKSGVLGYYSLPAPHQNTSVSIWNAGKRRRDQLNYLRRMYRKHAGRVEAKGGAA